MSKIFLRHTLTKKLLNYLYLMGNNGEDYPHLITDGAMVDQVQHLLS
jgi:hypothetical protein